MGKFRILAAMKVAICQMINTIDLEANYLAIETHFIQCKAGGASLIAFPECALTGFHGKVRNTPPEETARQLDKVAALCKKFKLAALVPFIKADNEGGFLNTAFAFDEKGEQIFELYKKDLTESEKLFFKLGPERERHFSVKGKKFSVLFCYEIHNPEIIAEIAASDSDVVLWPGYWGWGKSVDWHSETEKGRRIREHIALLGKPLLQVNYSTDPKVKTPEEALQGNSIVCNREGRLIMAAGLYQEKPEIIDLTTL
jgi:omega-amidase